MTVLVQRKAATLAPQPVSRAGPSPSPIPRSLEKEINMSPIADGEVTQKASSWWRRPRQFNPLRWQTIPPAPAQQSVSREAHAGILSRVTFTWVSPLMHLGYLRPLEPNDIPLVAPHHSAAVITDRLHAAFEKRRGRGDQYPLLWALNETFFAEFWIGGACRVAADCLIIMISFVLR